MKSSPQGRIRKFSDDELRHDLAAGLATREIAEKYGVSQQAVNKRRNQLGLLTTAATVAPAESQRFVESQNSALEALAHCLRRIQKLQDAYDAYLRDPDQPDEYYIGPRSSDIEVVYFDLDDDGKTKRAKASLESLLARVEQRWAVERAEGKIADPRVEMRATAQEIRATVETMVKLAQLLADARAMQTLRDALLSEIAKVDEQVARRIAEAVRRSLVLSEALGGPDSLAPARIGGGA